MTEQNKSVTVTVNNALGVATAESSHWLDPYVSPPPFGSNIMLLTWGSRQIEGNWGHDGHILYAAWAPKLSRPGWLKKRMYQHYMGTYKPEPVSPKAKS